MCRSRAGKSRAGYGMPEVHREGKIRALCYGNMLWSNVAGQGLFGKGMPAQNMT